MGVVSRSSSSSPGWANPLGILGHLQLEILGQPNELLMLLYNGLKFEKKAVLEQVSKEARRENAKQG